MVVGYRGGGGLGAGFTSKSTQMKSTWTKSKQSRSTLIPSKY